MTRLRVAALTLALCGIVSVNGQASDANTGDETNEAYTKQLCLGKEPGEWFRLDIKDCRDVIQCTEGTLQALRCPHGLAFDLELQTCDWTENVFKQGNCQKKTKTRKVKPLFNTVEPLCQNDMLACGDGTCLDKQLFCDEKVDCPDGSDETVCDIANDPNAAPICNKEECLLPDCFCYNNAKEMPNGMNPKNVPQMITITFDDAINTGNIDLYEVLFGNQTLLNPNQCAIKGTFFVSHKYSNYSAVQELHRLGHEIAVHSISHNSSTDFWTNATEEQWTKEMAGARVISERFANITDQSIIGMRAPFNRVGSNKQFKMMEDQAFLYDSSVNAPLGEVPHWPYTLYYRMPHQCHGHLQECPTRSFAVWEMVMNEMDRREDPLIEEPLPGCVMVDSCFSSKPTGNQFYKFLQNNFDRHYSTNRAPLGLFFQSAFLKNNHEVRENFIQWIQEVLANHNDVYFVTMTQVIQWMQDTRTVNELPNFEPWKDKCIVQGQPMCYGGNNCELNTQDLPGETLFLPTCMTCPNNYPWLQDPTGEGYF